MGNGCSGGFYLFRRSLKGITICYALLIGNAGFYRGLRPSNLQCWFFNNRSRSALKVVTICYALLISNAGLSRSRRSLKGLSICYAFLISNAGFNRSRRSLKEGNYLLRPSNQQCWFLPFQAKACGQQMLWFSRHVVRLERKVEVISAEGYLFRCSRYLFQPCLAAADDAAPAHHMHLLYSSFCSV